MLIQTQNISGHGLIDATGGNGIGYGFGGAGGRMAVHVNWFREFSGDYIAYGGFGGTSVPGHIETGNGAAGTVFITDSNDQGVTNKQTELINGTLTFVDGFVYLLIDNDNRNKIIGTVVMREDSKPFEFDMLEANNHAVLWLDGSDSELIVHKFDGDRTGSMHLVANQKLWVEYVQSTSGYTVAPVSYNIENGAEVVLPSTTIILGTRTEMKGLMTMVQNLTIADGAKCSFSSTAQTALIENGNYTHVTNKGNISLSHLTVQRGSEAVFIETEANLVLFLIKISIKFEGLMWMNKGSIYSREGVIESLAVLDVNFKGHDAGMGTGAGGSSRDYGYGGSYGGHGGAPKPQVGGTPYGSVYEPVDMGSGGGSGSGQGGRGGGYLFWNNGDNLWIDGELTLEGEAGQSGNGGGGSGGGLFIKTLNFTGFGHIDCHGGSGIGSGGGGSGGRIAVHIGFQNKYRGRLNVTGGLGLGSLPSGAAGTVYLEENRQGPQYAEVKYNPDTLKYETTATHKRLEIDNEHIDKHLYEDHAEPWLYTVLSENQDVYEFDEIDLTRHANLQIDYPADSDFTNPAVIVYFHLFYGDRTGLLHIRDRQKVYIEVVESISNETVAPCSFRIDNGSEALFPVTTNLMGTRTVLGGKITGVETMNVRGGADVVFLSTAQTALIENREYIMETTPGNFSFAILRIMAYSIAEFRDITGVCVISVAKFYVKFEGLLQMNAVKIESTYGHIESHGILDMDGMGHGPEQGPGAGLTLPDIYSLGEGAGHGGYGGGPGPKYGGVPYNSIYIPFEAGSGGGSGIGTGGSGGGRMEWDNAELIEMNGLLTLAGTDGSGGHSGGGSGGSLVIHTLNITGHGVITVHGGNGVGHGGGGSGGRVSVNCQFRYSYGGKYHNYGGNGGTQNSHHGAAGTTFKEENLRELEYRHKKYDPVLNTTYLEVDHHMLHADNADKRGAPTVIQDPDTVAYEFDEVDITGLTYAWIYNVTGANMTIHKFLGDKTGQLHVRPTQKIVVEVVESVNNVTEAPVSYIIDYGAEAIYPSELHIHGTNSTFAGTITGVHNLFIENGSWVEFMSTANTALIENREYTRNTTEGHFQWSQLHVKLGGKAGFLDVLNDLFIDVSECKVKYQADLYMNDATIKSTYAWIESEGVFHLNGHGHPAESGPGKGSTVSGQGYGASHGGHGGGTDPDLHTDPYGSIFRPSEAGSGGGNGSGTGGNGGGVLHWINSHYFELHGLLAVQGTNGTGDNAGGGSGGSVLIESMNFTGHGEINTEGGSGTGTGGGGAGGRAGIHCEWRYTFGGKFINHGGVSGTEATYAKYAGAAGTTFVKNNKRPLEYRKLKYKDGGSTAYFEVDHR